MNTISNEPASGGLDGLAARRDEYAQDADRLAASLTGPSLDDLTKTEEELLAQLDDVRRRKAVRAVREAEHRAAAEAADFFDGLIARTRARIEQARGGLLLDRPRPDALAGLPGLVKDAREETVTAVSGGYPITPANGQPSMPEAPGLEVVRNPTTPGLDSVGPADALVATSGPMQTQPDPGAAHPVPNPPPPPPAAPSAPFEPAFRGPRHKKGGRK
ncbi:hypothetical protein GCM10010402_66410 [Actinomadura luteofluorescens]|uniref:hypothetical protein n=1 Tax=Actinomadura luteofluorescens TaxID=46163 RepID=UPI002164C3A5|nr:hypothetical protein [Actinomadura glauciflava]MCR3744187.1 hypothetical protein [Actinomadura glauciflava]